MPPQDRGHRGEKDTLVLERFSFCRLFQQETLALNFRRKVQVVDSNG